LADLNTFYSTRGEDYDASAHEITLAKIATFYGTTDVKAGLISNILEFKKIEFLGEGLRWLDILRYKLPVTHNVLGVRGDIADAMVLGAEDPRRLFQLPTQATLSGLELNPR